MAIIKLESRECLFKNPEGIKVLALEPSPTIIRSKHLVVFFNLFNHTVRAHTE